jgi:heme oxygenase
MATILTEHTRAKHKEVEGSDFVQYMFTGKITKEHYVTYLQQMWHIYSTLESYADFHGLFEGMQDLKRTMRITKDIVELGGMKTDPFPSTQAYVDHLVKLADTEPNKLMAHIYVRHMGDLYGGKMIGKLVPGSSEAYAFEDRPAMIAALTEKITIDLLPEAIAGFDYCMAIFNELKKELNI